MTFRSPIFTPKKGSVAPCFSQSFLTASLPMAASSDMVSSRVMRFEIAIARDGVAAGVPACRKTYFDRKVAAGRDACRYVARWLLRVVDESHSAYILGSSFGPRGGGP